MAVLNRDKPYDHAHGIVQDHEPFFFQDGCAFTHSGVEVFKDAMGNFSILSTSKAGIMLAKQLKSKAVEPADVTPEVVSELVADDVPEAVVESEATPTADSESI